MIRRILAISLLVLCSAVGAFAGFIGMDVIEKPSGTGLTPYSQPASGKSPAPGVWKTWPATNTAADTTQSYSVFCRDARRIVWWVSGTGAASAPCSLLTVYVSQHDSSWVDASSVGMTINDFVTGANIDTSSAAAGAGNPGGASGQTYGANGRPIEVTIGGVSRIAWDRCMFVMTRKKGAAGAADSIRITARVQAD